MSPHEPHMTTKNKRSLTIARHRTTVTLEDAFWDALGKSPAPTAPRLRHWWARSTKRRRAEGTSSLACRRLSASTCWRGRAGSRELGAPAEKRRKLLLQASGPDRRFLTRRLVAERFDWTGAVEAGEPGSASGVAAASTLRLSGGVRLTGEGWARAGCGTAGAALGAAGVST